MAGATIATYAALYDIDRIRTNRWLSTQKVDGAAVELEGGRPHGARALRTLGDDALQAAHAHEVVARRVSNGPLAKPAVMMQAEARLKANQSIGFVDTDCIREVGQVFEAEALLTHYKSMQKPTSATFKAAMSPLAQREWM
jgi:hypothetical protein